MTKYISRFIGTDNISQYFSIYAYEWMHKKMYYLISNLFSQVRKYVSFDALHLTFMTDEYERNRINATASYLSPLTFHRGLYFLST